MEFSNAYIVSIYSMQSENSDIGDLIMWENIGQLGLLIHFAFFTISYPSSFTTVPVEENIMSMSLSAITVSYKLVMIMVEVSYFLGSPSLWILGSSMLFQFDHWPLSFYLEWELCAVAVSSLFLNEINLGNIQNMRNSENVTVFIKICYWEVSAVERCSFEEVSLYL